MEKSEVKIQPTVKKDNEIILLFMDMYKKGVARYMKFIQNAEANLKKMLKSDELDNKDNTLVSIYKQFKKQNYTIDNRITKFMLKK